MKFYEGFDKERAAQLAPAIRMLLGENGFSIKTVATEKDYDLSGKNAVTVKNIENLDEQYAAIEKLLKSMTAHPNMLQLRALQLLQQVIQKRLQTQRLIGFSAARVNTPPAAATEELQTRLLL